jgi:hypothetical protein
MWPNLTNIQPNIANKIKSYGDSMEASKLNAWIRVFSGAKVGNSNGLIMQSNVNRKLFRAVGETSATIYGDLQSSGVLGVDWGNRAVETGIGRISRPSPVITGFNVKEGKDQISRQATLEIKAFSLEQMEKIQSFFLEPGYSLYIEWGWNTRSGISGFTPATGSAEAIVKTIADKSLSWTNLSKTRTNSSGEFDCFLGFIVGGNVSGDSENFNVSVNLRGAPSLPTYMQSYQGTSRIDADGKIAESRRVFQLFGNTESESETSTLRRFGKMFNDLPTFRQTTDVESLKSEAAKNQFINFDEVIKKQVALAVSSEWYKTDAIEVTVTASDGKAKEEVPIAKEDLFSDKRYIRMDLAVKILNKIGAIDRYTIGDKEVTFQIDIDNTVIGSFPYQYSAKADKLIIPGQLPDFFQYYLQSSQIKQLEGGILEVDGNPKAPRGAKDGLEYFRRTGDLIPPTGEDGKPKDGYFKEKEGYYGYLKYLFVNFDMFKEKIEQKNKNVREIFLDILNEMSSAVNSFWNFQIVEGQFKENPDIRPGVFGTQYNTPKKDGDIILTVIDENFIGQNPSQEEAVYFEHVGVGSVFLDANIDISIPAEMTNQIVMTRIGGSANPDEALTSTNKKSFFETTGDLFTSAVSTTATAASNEVTSSAETQALQASTGFASKQEEYDLYVKAAADLRAQREKLSSNKITTQAEADDFNNLTKAANKFDQEANRVKRELDAEAKEKVKQELEAKSSTLTAFLKKLTVVPISSLETLDIKENDLNDESELQIDKLKAKFNIYTFDDTEYLDLLKRAAFGNKTGTGNLSHPLPIKYSFKILGNSGIRRGDTFNIRGIPSKYAKHGLFQVTQIEHSLDGNQWFTNITGDYRQIQ